jgi:hypothetical protein
MWKNVVQPKGPLMTIWRMRSACCVNQATNTHPQYVTLIAFPLQQWLHQRPSMLLYTYIACLDEHYRQEIQSLDNVTFLARLVLSRWIPPFKVSQYNLENIFMRTIRFGENQCGRPRVPTVNLTSTLWNFWVIIPSTLRFSRKSLWHGHTPHNDVSVNEEPHIRRWSHNIIIPLCYNCLQYSVQ